MSSCFLYKDLKFRLLKKNDFSYHLDKKALLVLYGILLKIILFLSLRLKGIIGIILSILYYDKNWYEQINTYL